MLKSNLLVMHVIAFVTLEQIGGPVAQIKQDEHERESDTRDKVNPCSTFRSTGEPTSR